LVLGEAISVPTLVKVGKVKDKPDSHDIAVLREWREDWRDLPFSSVLDGMKRK
jgi:hypothetical protein